MLKIASFLLILVVPQQAVDSNHEAQGGCFIGSRQEVRAELNATRGSHCCAAAEIYLARRPGGYCPETQATPLLPFSTICSTDGSDAGDYIPDASTAALAADLVCSLSGCAAAVADVVARLNSSSLALPACRHTSRDSAVLSQVRRAAIVTAAGCVALAFVGVWHCILGPWWIDGQVAASPIQSGKSCGAESSASNAMWSIDHVGKPSPGLAYPNVAVLGTSPNTTAIPRVFGAEVEHVASPGIVGADVSKADADVSLDVSAVAGLQLARVRCRAHVQLLCVLTFASALLRSSLSAATMPEGPAIVVLFLCLWQAAVLICLWQSPLTEPIASFRGCHRIGKMHVLASATFMSEFLVLSIYVGFFFHAPLASTDSGVAGGVDTQDVFPLATILEPLALGLVMIRVYTAWLAHVLHACRVELTYAVVPERAVAAHNALTSLDGVLEVTPSWIKPSEHADRLVSLGSRLFRLCRASHRTVFVMAAALALLLGTSAVGLWRAHRSEVQLSRSSCRTLTRGVDFCVPLDYLGLFQVMESADECCHSCDLAAGCDAWSFAEGQEASGGRCWMMRFLEEPCRDHPGHPDCRCHTGSDRTGGYKMLPSLSFLSGPV